MPDELWLMLDADSIVVKAAMLAQYNTCLYKDGERIKPIKSKKQWMEENPDENPDDYEFRKEATLRTQAGIPMIEKAKSTIRKSIKKVQKKYPKRLICVCLEGEGN